MKTTWRAVAGALVVLALAAPSAQAQKGGARDGMRGGARMSQTLMKDITLDATQKAKVDSIQAAYRKEMPRFTRGERPDEASMAKRRELMQKLQDDIRAVLDPEQQKLYERNLAELRERMQRRGVRGGAGR